MSLLFPEIQKKNLKIVPFILFPDIQQGLDVFELDDPAFPDKSQYSADLDTDRMIDDIIPASLPSSYGNKAYENPAAMQAHMWEQPDQDWRMAQY